MKLSCPRDAVQSWAPSVLILLGFNTFLGNPKYLQGTCAMGMNQNRQLMVQWRRSDVITNNKRKTEHNLDPHGGDPDGEEIESTLKVRRDYWRRCL